MNDLWVLNNCHRYQHWFKMFIVQTFGIMNDCKFEYAVGEGPWEGPKKSWASPAMHFGLPSQSLEATLSITNDGLWHFGPNSFGAFEDC